MLFMLFNIILVSVCFSVHRSMDVFVEIIALLRGLLWSVLCYDVIVSLCLLVVRRRQTRLYFFSLDFPSSRVTGMLRSGRGEDRGAVMVNTPSADRLEETSTPDTPAGSLYFLRNSRDTKPWSSWKQRVVSSTPDTGR